MRGRLTRRSKKTLQHRHMARRVGYKGKVRNGCHAVIEATMPSSLWNWQIQPTPVASSRRRRGSRTRSCAKCRVERLCATVAGACARHASGTGTTFSSMSGDAWLVGMCVLSRAPDEAGET